MIRSANKITAPFSEVKNLNEKLSGVLVKVRGRLQTSRAKGKQCFIVLRQQQYTIQCFLCVNDVVSKQMVKFASV